MSTLYDNFYTITWYTDAQTGQKISIPRMAIPIQVIGNKIELGEIPNTFNHVVIDGMTEKDIASNLTDNTQFKCDYNLGIIYFYDTSLDGQTKNIMYYANGAFKHKAKNSILESSFDFFSNDNVDDALKENAQRINNLVLNTSNPAEVTDAHLDGNTGTTYATLKDRLDKLIQIITSIPSTLVKFWIRKNSSSYLPYINDGGNFKPLDSAAIVNEDGSNRITPNQIGILSNLNTTTKDNLVNAINEHEVQIGDFSANGLSETSLAQAIKNDRSSLADITPYNIYRDIIFGQEYLSAFHKKIMNYSSGNLIVNFEGDSTTAGDATTAPYHLNTVLDFLLSDTGLSYISTVNHGVSGGDTVNFNNNLVNQQALANNPDLMIIRYGINDARADLNTSTYENALRGALQKIRSARPLSSLSIILMTPNAIDCAQYPEKNPAWNKAINPIIRQVAKDFNCCFIDTFAIWNDATDGQDWMDSYLVHPQDVANLWIGSRIFDVIFPKAVIGKFNKNTNKFYNEANLTGNGLLTVLTNPADFPVGISIYKTYPTGWPYVGNVITFKTNNIGVFQINFSTDVSSPNYAVRMGNLTSNTWSAWKTSNGVIPTPTAPTLQNSWTNFDTTTYEAAGYYIDSSNVVHIQGLIKGGTKSANATIFTLPAGFRPSKTKFFTVASSSGTGTNTLAAISITNAGNVQYQFGENGWLSLDGVTFLATQ